VFHSKLRILPDFIPVRDISEDNSLQYICINSMATSARSDSGCWTCRLRRKKCDETHPACLQCQSVHLACHGFGDKPEWMDGGAKARAKLVDVKLMVAKTIKERRAQRAKRSRIRTIIDMQDMKSDTDSGKVTMYSHLSPEIVTPLSTEENGSRNGQGINTQKVQKSLQSL
jgi:hypothetical protein